MVLLIYMKRRRRALFRPPQNLRAMHAFPESLQIHCRTLLLSPATALFPSAPSLTTMDNSSSTDSPYILPRSSLHNHLSNIPIVDSAVPRCPSDERQYRFEANPVDGVFLRLLLQGRGSARRMKARRGRGDCGCTTRGHQERLGDIFQHNQDPSRPFPLTNVHLERPSSDLSVLHLIFDGTNVQQPQSLFAHRC